MVNKTHTSFVMEEGNIISHESLNFSFPDTLKRYYFFKKDQYLESEHTNIIEIYTVQDLRHVGH